MAGSGVVAGDIRGLTRSLKAIEPDLAKAFKRQLKSDVADPVAQRIKTRIPRGPGRPSEPGKRGRHWYQDIRSGATSKAAYIQWGRNTTPYAPWVEFGGTIRQPKRGVTITREIVRKGRYVWPEIERSRAAIYQTTKDVLAAAHRRAGLPLE